MDEQRIIQMVVDTTIKGFTHSLKKYNLLQLEPTAFERTRNDIIFLKDGMEILSNEQVPLELKQELAIQLKQIQNSIKELKDHVDEQDYILFSEYSLTRQSLRSIAAKYGIDEGTVKRAFNRCINRLSIHLHPDLYLNEIFY